MRNGVLQQWSPGWTEEEEEEEASDAVEEIQEQSQTQSPHYLSLYMCSLCGLLDHLQLWWHVPLSKHAPHTCMHTCSQWHRRLSWWPQVLERSQRTKTRCDAKFHRVIKALVDVRMCVHPHMHMHTTYIDSAVHIMYNDYINIVMNSGTFPSVSCIHPLPGPLVR